MIDEHEGKNTLRESSVVLIVMAIVVLAVLVLGAVTLIAQYG